MSSVLLFAVILLALLVGAVVGWVLNEALSKALGSKAEALLKQVVEHAEAARELEYSRKKERAERAMDSVNAINRLLAGQSVPAEADL